MTAEKSPQPLRLKNGLELELSLDGNGRVLLNGRDVSVEIESGRSRGVAVLRSMDNKVKDKSASGIAWRPAESSFQAPPGVTSRSSRTDRPTSSAVSWGDVTRASMISSGVIFNLNSR